MDKLTKAEQYAEDVRNKRILTCELVQLAVKRYYNDLRDALDKGWYFDRKAAMRAIGFIERLRTLMLSWRTCNAMAIPTSPRISNTTM